MTSVLEQVINDIPKNKLVTSQHYEGANLVSFYALPENTEISSMFSSIFTNTLGVLGEGYAAYNLNDTWIGALLSIEPSSGYWMIMNNDEILYRLNKKIA